MLSPTRMSRCAETIDYNGYRLISNRFANSHRLFSTNRSELKAPKFWKGRTKCAQLLTIFWPPVESIYRTAGGFETGLFRHARDADISRTTDRRRGSPFTAQRSPTPAPRLPIFPLTPHLRSGARTRDNSGSHHVGARPLFRAAFFASD